MNKFQIALKYANALPVTESKGHNSEMAATFAASMMQLGFVPSKDLYVILDSLHEDEITSLFNSTIAELRKMKGADVNYTPMYPNFPQQVMEASDVELFVNAILHYWTLGHWQPDYEKLPRDMLFEKTEFKEIGAVGPNAFNDIFTKLLSSNESLSATDKETVLWFLDNDITFLRFPDEIPFKENMATVAAHQLEAGRDVSGFVKTATDVLRVITGMSGGDVSLAENTKFKSQKRKVRRAIVALLDGIDWSEEDFNRHRGKWVKAFHSLHIGEYSSDLYAVAKKLRENQKIETFNGKVQEYIDAKNVKSATQMLMSRPSEFARRIDHLMRLTRTKTYVIDSFLKVADKVPTRVLMQLLGNLKNRTQERDHRVVFPKGATQKARILHETIAPLSKPTVVKLMDGIVQILVNRFSELEEMGNVYIDPELAYCPLPTQQRSASEGMFQVARGTHMPIGDKGTLRFFIYWKGQDIDLSASLHNEEFGLMEHISYTNLRSAKYQAAHSGDITRAPNGASEFIDINIEQAVNCGARYVVMNVYVFAGPNFADHEKCYAGWMTRKSVQSGEVYEPKTVKQKVDLTANSRNAIPVVFDLVERKAIWTDLSTTGRSHFGGNNIHSNQATVEQTLQAITSLDNKVNLYELFKMHAHARGTLVEDREDADVVFAMDEGVTPYDIATINSDFLV